MNDTEGIPFCAPGRRCRSPRRRGGHHLVAAWARGPDTLTAGTPASDLSYEVEATVTTGDLQLVTFETG